MTFNSFPQPKPDGVSSPWVHDWSAYQTVYDLTGTTVSVLASTWQTFVNVTGKGFFKWCRASDSNGISPNPDIRLTIDGQVYLFAGVVTGISQHGNEINFQIPFKSSLKIEVLNSHVSTASNMMCDYLYLLQQSTPNSSKVTLLQQSQRKQIYLTTISTTLTDVVNIAGSGYLLGIRFLGLYGTAGGGIFGDIAINGTQIMTDRSLLVTDSTTFKQPEVVGPIRFNSSLRVRTRTSISGTQAICFGWYSLD